MKPKSLVTAFACALVSLAQGAVSITSPVDYATVTVMPSVMRDFRSTFATGKKWSLVSSSTLGSAQRVEWETACRASQSAVALAWSGTGSTKCTVKVYRVKDGKEVFSASSTTGERYATKIKPLLQAFAAKGGKYLIVSPSVNTGSAAGTSATAIEQQMASDFGDHYLNLRLRMENDAKATAAAVSRPTPALTADAAAAVSRPVLRARCWRRPTAMSTAMSAEPEQPSTTVAIRILVRGAAELRWRTTVRAGIRPRSGLLRPRPVTAVMVSSVRLPGWRSPMAVAVVAVRRRATRFVLLV